MASLIKPNGPLLNVSVDKSASGDLVAAVAGQRIRIYALFIVASATATIIFKNGSTALTGEMTMIAGVPYNCMEQAMGAPYFECSTGNAFVGTITGTVQVSGWIQYTVMPP